MSRFQKAAVLSLLVLAVLMCVSCSPPDGGTIGQNAANALQGSPIDPAEADDGVLLKAGPIVITR